MKLSQRYVILFKHILGSRRFLCLGLAIISFIAGLIVLTKNSNLRRRTLSTDHINIAMISMTNRYVHQSQLRDDIAESARQYLEDKDEKLIKSQMKNNQKYLLNYTDCLTKKFWKFEQVFSLKKLKFPLSFNEMMFSFHKECNSEVLGEIEDCSSKHQKTIGRSYIEREPIEMSALKKELADVRLGGLWSPLDCIPKAKVAIIIPFRRREKHLPVLLRYLHPLLQRQNLLYRIFVIEQADDYPFNRGKLMNIGFKEASNIFNFNCFVFHDVDLIPEDDRNDYGCPESPRHLSVAVNKFNYNLPYPGLFGGVELFTKEHYQLINGFRNSYWGWGAEDDDLYRRVIKVGLKLTRPSLSIGRYTMIAHESSEKPPDRMDKLQYAENALTSDGLLSMHYKVLSVEERLLYTLIKADLRMEDDMMY